MHPTPLELVRLTTEYLAKRGVESPRLDAEVLLAHVLGVPRIQLYVQFERPLEAVEVGAYRELVRRRGQREPVAHLVGRREFWSLELAVDGRVLVPRPETERLVEVSLERMGAAGRLVDLGTGSGAILLALLSEQPGWTGVGVDCSAAALEVAAANAAHHGLGDRVRWCQGNLFEPLQGERFELIVSNPPYIPRGEIAGLQPEVAGYDPHLALDGGADGLDLVRRIAAGAAEYLQPGGVVALEFGAGQQDDVRTLFAGAGYLHVELREDYAGIPRVVLAEAPR
ncbi:MAG: peptide chain release factor N(5)-glutamine methyltransferase [Deferrisomatales bacterium]|nr:peptide chain release factor N(5)-glutamine methyltransferase [Deferrisomatales bacterium]